MPPDAIGHRIVHGGRAYRETTRITAEVRQAIADQAEIAPSHSRLELEAIDLAARVFGKDKPQVAVFDTAFHATLEPAAYVYPGPHEWLEQGIRRFGFHGISHQYAARKTALMLARPDPEIPRGVEEASSDFAATRDRLRRTEAAALRQQWRIHPTSLRIVTCHLGNGCSLAAIRGGVCVDTTMGFTPLEGLMMGTRSGSLDPGILIYLLRHRRYSADELDGILNQQSGLLGLSGVSGDMREILAAMAQGNARAQLAFDVYAHRLCQGVGSMLASLGGLDALVFTGGVGENCARLREKVARRLEFLGLELDKAANEAQSGDRDIGTALSKAPIL